MRTWLTDGTPTPAPFLHVTSSRCTVSLPLAVPPFPPSMVLMPHIPPQNILVAQLDESLIASLANEDLVDSLLAELQEDFPQLLKPLLHDR